MSRGVVIHAYNNEQIDYALIALCNALLIRDHLQVPICLISDRGSLGWLRQQHGDIVDRVFDQIMYDDRSAIHGERRFSDTPSTSHMLPWYNTTRPDTYDLSPYTETLLIDADYLILDDTLNKVWGSRHEVMINRDIVSLNHGPTPTCERWLEETGIQLCWATCIYFRKSASAAMLFDLVKHVRQHYPYYSMIYGFPAKLYRNDYAFSIAVHMMSGFTRCDDIATLPSPVLLTSFDCDELIDVASNNDLVFLMNDRIDRWRFTLTRTKGVSVHVMNKFAITRHAEKFISRYRSNDA